MNGGQDLGGQMGFGPVLPEHDEPVFHADWEKRVLAMSVAAGGMGEWSIDESRHARESIHPVDYLSFTYYEIWFAGLAKLLLGHGFVSEAELAAGQSMVPARMPKRILKGTETAAALHRGWPSDRAVTSLARFQVGDRVRARNMHPKGHTRLPRYVRGKQGVISIVQPAPHVLPDAAAHGLGERPEWLYTVVFTGGELWGEGAEPGFSVSVEAWESYLERA